MGLPKGRTNNPKGRPKGSFNKVSKELRERIQAIVESSLDEIEQDLNELSPKDRLSFRVKLLDLVLPKYKSIEIEPRISDEEYQQFMEYKRDQERLDSMTEEELMEEIRRLEAQTNDKGWDCSKDDQV